MTDAWPIDLIAQHATIDLSIILVSYDSLSDLQRCLPTILGQATTFAYEIIVVDNHGADGVLAWIYSLYPDSRVLINTTNTGYAGGNNLGLAHARGQWSFLLNPDVELQPGSLQRLLETAHQFPDALITPKLLNPDGTINACGNQMHYTGITTCRGLNQSGDSLSTLHTVSLLSGAAIVGPTALIRQLGGFDETYFMYFEDTDLSLRARRQGVTLLCEGRARIVHHYTLNLNAAKFYYLERNRLLTFLKLFSRKTLMALFPAMLLTELITWVYGLRGWPFLKSRFQTYRYLWKNRAVIRQERTKLQEQPAAISDKELLAGSELSLPIGSVLPKPLGALVNRLTIGNIYRLLIPKWLR
ncbi:glycosyltransferase family 2 protein [soil metagenome]